MDDECLTWQRSLVLPMYEVEGDRPVARLMRMDYNSHQSPPTRAVIKDEGELILDSPRMANIPTA